MENCIVSADYILKVKHELPQLEKLLRENDDLVDKMSAVDPTAIEKAALAGMLHSFYNGVENIFKAISRTFDPPFLKNENWHMNLLQAMASENSKRSAVISEPLRGRLEGYLAFRHVFRSIYGFDLKWEKMKNLVTECRETFGNFVSEITTFLDNKTKMEKTLGTSPQNDS
jgi:hypothetical protein